MKKFLPDGAKQESSPELKEKIKNKKQELQSLKQKLKICPAAEKDSTKTQIKALVRELKTLSPKADLW
jgi:polyhydroxyalkanoate synthesis regulator phasin